MANNLFFTFLTVISSLSVWGQDVTLVNLTVSQKGSKTIYIGIENKFKVDGFENLVKVEPTSSIHHSFKEDTLVPIPVQAGSFTMTFQTKSGQQQQNFDIKVMSDVMPSIGNLTNQAVDKKDVIAQGNVKLHTFNTQDIYFENYKVSSFEAYLNKQTFTVQGDRFTDELITAIRQAKSGDKLILTNIRATNADIGKISQLHGRFGFELK